MPLPIQTFQQIVNEQITAMNANSNELLNFTPGSVLLALVQSNAANSIWLQALATQLLAVTRLSTSSGTDVDTFIADFGFSRFQGNIATGNVTFSRNTSTIQGTVQVGTIVSVASDNLTFIVTKDTTNPNWNATLGLYVLPVSTGSITVPASCQTSGSLGNVVANAINTINSQSTTTTFVDSVTNSAAFANGSDPWSDSLTKQNFVLYIQSLSRATKQAIQEAIVTTVSPDGQIPFRYNLVENELENGSSNLGYFYAVIDNGLGTTISNTLKTAISNNINLYRGFTIQYNVDAALFIATGVVSAVPAAAGSGYNVNDTITLAGGTGTKAILTVTAINGSGGVTAVSVTNTGNYTVLPANPISQFATSGGGTSATFTASFGIPIVVNISLIPQPSETTAQIIANVVAAIQAYTNTIPFNSPLLYSKLYEIVYDSDANIASIPSSSPITVNGSNADIQGNNLSVFYEPAAAITVNIL